MPENNDWMAVTEAEKLKYEIAEEIGVLPFVIEHGWAALDASTTGKIGGMVRSRMRKGEKPK